MCIYIYIYIYIHTLLFKTIMFCCYGMISIYIVVCHVCYMILVVMFRLSIYHILMFAIICAINYYIIMLNTSLLYPLLVSLSLSLLVVFLY